MPNYLRADDEFSHQEQDTDVGQQNLKIVETYWHDHSLVIMKFVWAFIFSNSGQIANLNSVKTLNTFSIKFL
jgi:hypothetical protein